MDRLAFDPTYPKYPTTLSDYVRKYRKDKGISEVELAGGPGVNEMSIVNWEVKGRVPQTKRIRERLLKGIPGVGRFLDAHTPHPMDSRN